MNRPGKTYIPKPAELLPELLPICSDFDRESGVAPCQVQDDEIALHAEYLDGLPDQAWV